MVSRFSVHVFDSHIVLKLSLLPKYFVTRYTFSITTLHYMVVNLLYPQVCVLKAKTVRSNGDSFFLVLLPYLGPIQEGVW